MINVKTGTLYVVATPIGNLEDITLRALRILKEVDCILCEDKRVTQKLLNHYQIKSKLISFQKFNERKMEDEILTLLKNGKNLALVSDAGTPLVCDPGASLIMCLHKKRFKVIAVPGASSLTAAMSLFGMLSGDVLFLGFLPPQNKKRKEVLQALVGKSTSVVFFAAPHDLKKYLSEIKETYPTVNICLAKELTKLHEECFVGRVSDVEELLSSKFANKVKGEYVVGLTFDPVKNRPVLSDEDLVVELDKMIANNYSLKEASRIFGEQHKVSKSKAYNIYIKNKKRG